jgi:hypothetical protein
MNDRTPQFAAFVEWLEKHGLTCPACRQTEVWFATLLKEIQLSAIRHDLILKMRCAKCSFEFSSTLGVTVHPNERAPLRQELPRAVDWTLKDKRRLGALPPISHDDVIDFHKLLESLPTAAK